MIRKKGKKLLALVMALAMVVTLLPATALTASASGATEDTLAVQKQTKAATALTTLIYKGTAPVANADYLSTNMYTTAPAEEDVSTEVIGMYEASSVTLSDAKVTSATSSDVTEPKVTSVGGKAPTADNDLKFTGKYGYGKTYTVVIKVQPVQNATVFTTDTAVVYNGKSVSCKKEYGSKNTGTSEKPNWVLDTSVVKALYFTYTFEATAKELTSITISDLEIPVAGKALDTTVTATNATVTSVEWYDSSDNKITGDELKSAKYGKEYYSVVKLEAAKGYAFSDTTPGVTYKNQKVDGTVGSVSSYPAASKTGSVVTSRVNYYATTTAKVTSVGSISAINVPESVVSTSTSGLAAVIDAAKKAPTDSDKVSEANAAIATIFSNTSYCADANKVTINTEAGTLKGTVTWDYTTVTPTVASGVKANRTYTVTGYIDADNSSTSNVSAGTATVAAVDLSNIKTYKVTGTFTVIGTNSVGEPTFGGVYDEDGNKKSVDSATGYYKVNPTADSPASVYIELKKDNETDNLYYTRSTTGTPADPTNDLNTSVAYAGRIKVVVKVGETVTMTIKARAYSSDEKKSSEIKTFTVKVVAAGTAVEEVKVTDLTAPVAGQALDTTATVTGANAATTTVSWKAGTAAASGTAKYGTAYTATVTLTAPTGNEYSAATAVSINGTYVNPTLSADNKTLTASVTFPATAKAKLVSVTAPTAVSVANGTSLTDIQAALPSTVAIVTEDSTVTSASVAWTLNGSYSPSASAATLTFTGKVTLPTTVDGTAADQTITVNVKAAAVGTPIASVPAGAYTTAQKVALTTTTAGATIYYTTDGTVPTTASTVYTGEITVDKTMTINAIAVATGMENSEVASYAYTITAAPEKLSQTITTGKDVYTPAYAEGKIRDLEAEASTALTFSSDKTGVATVDANGIVTIKGIGTATITITAAATDEYKAATKKVTITVKPAKTSINSVTSSKKGYLTVSYKSLKKVTGYQIQYSTSKKFTASTTKTVKVDSQSTVKKTIKSLKSGKTYYVRVRGYKGSLVGAWSAVKSVKVK